MGELGIQLFSAPHPRGDTGVQRYSNQPVNLCWRRLHDHKGITMP